MSIQVEAVPNNLCKYIHRYCYQQRIDGYDFCSRHILNDKTAPFKQCAYVHQLTRKRCTNAAPKTGERRDALCPFHNSQSTFIKEKDASTSRSKHAARSSVANILHPLEAYCKNKKHDVSFSYKNRDIASDDKCNLAPTYEECPESLKEPSLFSPRKLAKETYPLPSTLDMDHADLAVGTKDYLKYAGVFTEKEVIQMARKKTERLKHLYYEELKRTFFRLKEIRRTYLLESKEKSTPKIRHKFKRKLKAHLESYHAPHTFEKLLRHQREQKKYNMPSVQPKCTFKMGNDKICNQPAIPCTSYCINHIGSDSNISFFTKCAFPKCDKLLLPVGENVCKLHLFDTLVPDSKERGQTSSSTDLTLEQEHFLAMDDIASLGLDAIIPGSLFGLDQFGEPGESTDTVLSEEQNDLMQIQPITLNPPADILSDTRKSDEEDDK